jgi:hypothetical protein
MVAELGGGRAGGRVDADARRLAAALVAGQVVLVVGRTSGDVLGLVPRIQQLLTAQGLTWAWQKGSAVLTVNETGGAYLGRAADLSETPGLRGYQVDVLSTPVALDSEWERAAVATMKPGAVRIGPTRLVVLRPEACADGAAERD